MISIVPAFIPSSQASLLESLALLHGVPEIHLDLVDGVFVPFKAWPYEPIGIIANIQATTNQFTLEVDLMVEKPLTAASQWLQVGADMLVFHVENTNLREFADFQKRVGSSVTLSIAATANTPFSVLQPYLEVCDAVQLMGIATIGAQGQPFDARVLTRIEEVRAAFPKLPITIDGSVNAETILKLKAAGAHRFICGSAITKAINPLAAYQQLLKLAN